ncbi:MAG: ParB N-terminal domain-containing protein [Terriglobia bacterium]|nr:ParB N-terminal domain-containing protein [Terriglobia bacterium]
MSKQMSTAVGLVPLGIQFQRHGTQNWFWRGAPESWLDRVVLSYSKVLLEQIVPSESYRNPERVRFWMRQISQCRPIPPLIVCRTEGGQYYLQDGNHRYTAMQSLFGMDYQGEIEVAELIPEPGFEFRRIELGCSATGRYTTYVLVKQVG